MNTTMRHHRTLLLFAGLATFLLVQIFGDDPLIDLLGTTGSSVQKLALFAAWISLTVVAFRTFEHGRELSVGFAIFKASVILGGALCLVN